MRTHGETLTLKEVVRSLWGERIMSISKRNANDARLIDALHQSALMAIGEIGKKSIVKKRPNEVDSPMRRAAEQSYVSGNAHAMGGDILFVHQPHQLGTAAVAARIPEGAPLYITIDIGAFCPSIAPAYASTEFAQILTAQLLLNLLGFFYERGK